MGFDGSNNLSVRCRLACAVAAAVAWPGVVGAQAPAANPAEYPVRAVRIIVGYAPGGGVDIMARLFAQKFGETFKQSFFVENRPGAGGNIGTDLVAKAPADGYILLMTGPALGINVSLYPKLSYDPLKDFAPVSMVASTGTIIAAHPSMPVRTLQELIAIARKRPNEVLYASAGSGSPQHLAMELFQSMAKIRLVHVPYNGGGPSLASGLAGHTAVLSAALPIALPHVRIGKLKALGVTTAKRSALAPDLPTVAEAGPLPGYDVNPWYMLLAPAGTPAAIVNKLNAEIERLLQTREVADRMVTLGFDSYRTTPAQTQQIIKAEIELWSRVIREAGVKVD